MTELPTGTILGNLAMQEVFEYYDFLRIFTCINSTGQSYVVLSTFDDDSECRWLYLPISLLRQSAIVTGQLSLHVAFRRPEGGYAFLVKTFENRAPIVEYVLPEHLSDEDLPAAAFVLSAVAHDVGTPVVTEPAAVARATRRVTFNYHIFPEQKNTHEIAARKLGGILTSTQELVDALGQAASGQPTVRGPIPAELLQHTKINVAHVFQSSFGVQFRAAEYSDLVDESKVAEAIAEFCDLLLAADSEDLLSEKLHLLKGRVASKYRRLLKELTDINSGLVLQWCPVNVDRGGKFSLTSEQVRRAYAIVDQIDIEMAEELAVSGKLIGFNSRTQRYEILSTDDFKTYAGKVADDAQINVSNPSIGEFYIARLRMLVETQSTSGDELIRWVLVGLDDRR